MGYPLYSCFWCALPTVVPIIGAREISITTELRRTLVKENILILSFYSSLRSPTLAPAPEYCETIHTWNRSVIPLES